MVSRVLYYIKDLTNTEDKKRVISNFFSLSVLQGANYILPLITFPYLVKVLGIEYFGLLAYVTSIFIYFGLFLDYGFNLSATRNIAKNRENTHYLNEVFTSVYTFKALISFFAFIIFLFFLEYNSFVKENYLLFIVSFLNVFFQSTIPVFFLMGLEKMKALSVSSIIFKLVSTVIIFVFVNAPEDIFIVPLAYLLGNICNNIFSFIYIKRIFTLKIIFLNFKTFLKLMTEGWSIFVGIISTNVIYYLPLLFLGSMGANYEVGIYSIAENIMRAVRNLVYPMASAILPYSSRVAKNDINKSLKINLKISILFFVALFFVALLVYGFSDEIVSLISKDHDVNIKSVLGIILLSVPFHAIIHIFMTQSLLNLNAMSLYRRAFIFATLLSLLINLILVPTLKLYGAAYAYSLSELALLITLAISVKKAIYKR